MDVYVAGTKVRLKPDQAVGKGGEADVYRIAPDRALKLWKGPDHPDLAGLPAEQQAAEQRMALYAEKLGVFPRLLPPRVVLPEEPVTDRSGRKVLGYTMRFVQGAELLLRYAERSFRSGVGNEAVKSIFLDLHGSVAGLHAAGVTIGDFNDLNVMVVGADAHLIDADSYQFGAYVCPVFTARFVDPLLCDPAAPALLLARPHRPESDWYAYAVMLMQCLLYVGPYGGVYRPKSASAQVPHDLRPLRRITVFHAEVRYPKPALPPETLPDDLLQHFHEVFEQDRRGPFPRLLLERLRWTRCAGCGIEHARRACPACATAVPVPAQPVRVRGTVTAATVFRTAGRIVAATWQDGRLLWLAHEGGEFRREDGSVVFRGAPDARMRIALRAGETLIGKGGQVVRLRAGAEPAKLAADQAAGTTVFDANARGAVWMDQGRLFRDGPAGPEGIGDALAGQTLFWMGAKFGFGFYRAGGVRVAFVFDAQRAGVRDTVPLPPLRGGLVVADCVFAEERAWFTVRTEEAGRLVSRCLLVRADGSVEASAEDADGGTPWLARGGGACAHGDALFVPTDEGIVRVQASLGALVKTGEYPDTEPFVDAGCRLLPGPGGLHAVAEREIQLLKIR